MVRIISDCINLPLKEIAGSFNQSDKRKRSRSRSPRRRGQSPPRGPRADRRSRSRSRSPRYSRRDRSFSPAYGQKSAEEEGEAVTDTFIRAVAAEIKGHDATYERNLREHERGNQKFAFLLDRHVSILLSDIVDLVK